MERILCLLRNMKRHKWLPRAAASPFVQLSCSIITSIANLWGPPQLFSALKASTNNQSVWRLSSLLQSFHRSICCFNYLLFPIISFLLILLLGVPIQIDSSPLCAGSKDNHQHPWRLLQTSKFCFMAPSYDLHPSSRSQIHQFFDILLSFRHPRFMKSISLQSLRS